MKKILTLLLIIISIGASAQSWTTVAGSQRFTGRIGIPVKDTVTGGIADSAQMVIRPADGQLWYKYKTSWVKSSGTPVDLSGYVRKAFVDTITGAKFFTTTLTILGSDSNSGTVNFNFKNAAGESVIVGDNSGGVTIGANGRTTTPLSIYGNTGLQMQVGNNIAWMPPTMRSAQGTGLNIVTIGVVSGDSAEVKITGNSANVAGGQANTILRITGSNQNVAVGSFENSGLILDLNQTNATSGQTSFANGLYVRPIINNTNGTSTYRGIYYNPTLTSATNTTNIAFEATTGKVKLGDLASSGDRMVISGSDGTLATTSLPYTKPQSDSANVPYNTQPISVAPVFLDQFINNFYGRGMMTSEPINITTEQFIGSSYSAGVDVIKVSDTSKFKVGGLATIKHANGLYYTYFISQKSGDGSSGTLGIKPSLKYPVTSASKIERTWFNRAHPGKFYMRQLAQQIANATEIDAAIPTGNRILYTNFSDTPQLSKDLLAIVGSATINYYQADNQGIDASSPVRFIIGNTPYVGISAAGDGAETPLFYIDRPKQAVASVALMSSNNSNAYSIRIINDSNRTVATFKIPTSESKNTYKIYKFPFFTSFSNKIKVRIVADTFTTSANISIAQIDVFEQPATNKKVISKQRSVIVGLGDSWMQGDLGSTSEREPITQQLAIELPYATIVNAGIGGNTITDMLNRFDTDVAPYNPDYVIIETGTNDVYNPPSTVFYPTGVDDWINLYNQLIFKVLSIGAKPIIMGVPALAQSDADVPTWPEWILNDRARLYEQKFYRFLSKQTSVGGDYEWKLSTSDTAAMLSNYLKGVVQTSNGGTGKSTWTAGSIPFVGTGSGSPFVEVNNSLYYDSTNKGLRIGSNTMYHNEHLTIGAFTTPKINMVATGGYYWSTRVDGADNQQWKLRYENDNFDVIIADTSHNVTMGGNVSAQNLYGTSYTPTLTNTTNITSSSLSSATYSRVGDVVTARIGLTLTPDFGGTTTVLTFTLPVTSSITSQALIGTGTQYASGGSSITGIVDATSTTAATFTFHAFGGGVSSSVVIQFQYKL